MEKEFSVKYEGSFVFPENGVVNDANFFLERKNWWAFSQALLLLFFYSFSSVVACEHFQGVDGITSQACYQPKRKLLIFYHKNYKCSLVNCLAHTPPEKKTRSNYSLTKRFPIKKILPPFISFFSSLKVLNLKENTPKVLYAMS